jgi:hypothetical protein
MAMSGTRTRKQDGRITRIGVYQSLLPFANHTFGAPDGIGKLLHRPVGMLLEQDREVGTFANPINFHQTLLPFGSKRRILSQCISEKEKRPPLLPFACFIGFLGKLVLARLLHLPIT